MLFKTFVISGEVKQHSNYLDTRLLQNFFIVGVTWGYMPFKKFVITAEVKEIAIT